MDLQSANFGNLFGVDGLIVLAIGLIIFGRRLPEVARNLRRALNPTGDLVGTIDAIFLLILVAYLVLLAFAAIQR